MRKEQAMPTHGEDMRQVVVHGDGAGKTWEVGERGIGAETQGEEYGTHGEDVEPASSEDRHDDQAEQAVILRQTTVHCHDSAVLGQPGSAEQENDEIGSAH